MYLTFWVISDDDRHSVLFKENFLLLFSNTENMSIYFSCRGNFLSLCSDFEQPCAFLSIQGKGIETETELFVFLVSFLCKVAYGPREGMISYVVDKQIYKVHVLNKIHILVATQNYYT